MKLTTKPSKPSMITAGKLAAAAALFASLLAGCGGNAGSDAGAGNSNGSGSSVSGKSGNAEANDAADNEQKGPYAKHLDIKWIGHNQIGIINDAVDNPVKKMIEEKFNVTITMVPLDVHNKEQVNLYFADGESADHIRLNVASNFLMEQGLVREIPEDKLRALMPAWMKAIEGMVDPEIVKASMKFKGKLYAVPFINYASLQPWVMGIRKDWLDNVGITKLPETLEEYHEVLKRFTFNDPDQNGKNDTYGGHGIQLYLRGAFGIGSGLGIYLDENEKVYASVLTDKYKDYLKTARAWYEEGLIDPESITDERPQQRAKWAAGKFGILADHPWWYALSTPTNVTQMVLGKNPQAKIEFLKPFTGPDGDSGAGGVGYPMMQAGFFFGKDTSDEKMERIMAIKEFMAADDNFYVRAYFGEEGQGYTRNDHGTIILDEAYKSVEKITEEGLAQYFALRPETWEFAKNNLIEKADLPAYEISMSSPKKYSDVDFTIGGTNESLLKYSTAVTTIVTEFETNARVGKVDIDREWDAYKKKFLEAGGQAVLDEYQKLYDETKK